MIRESVVRNRYPRLENIFNQMACWKVIIFRIFLKVCNKQTHLPTVHDENNISNINRCLNNYKAIIMIIDI